MHPVVVSELPEATAPVCGLPGQHGNYVRGHGRRRQEEDRN